MKYEASLGKPNVNNRLVLFWAQEATCPQTKDYKLIILKPCSDERENGFKLFKTKTKQF